MPWTIADPPESYKNFTARELSGAVSVANAMLDEGRPEGEALETGAKVAKAETNRSRRRRGRRIREVAN